MKKTLSLITLVFLHFSLTGQMCTKDLVTAKDFYTTPFKTYLSSDKKTAMEETQKVLENQGYEIQNVDDEKGRITTGWRPVAVDSHYFPLFERKDYGASDGAYYQLLVDVADEANQVKVSVATKVKTIVGKLESSGKLEKKVIASVENAMRSPQIEITNVGIKRK